MARAALAGLALLLTLGLGIMPGPVWAAESPLVAQQLHVPTPEGDRDVTLWVAQGFQVGVFASGLGSARILAESPTGELVLSEQWEGQVVKLADRDGDGTADERVVILSGLNVPHGLVFAGDVLFVAETDRVLRLDVWWNGASAREIIRLPGGGHHLTRSLALGPDGKLYVSIGSTCDVCRESDPLRAAVWRFNLDGSGGEPYVTGLRNAVGLAWEPGAGRLWATDNGQDALGDETPPDEIDVLRPGANYGWPDCYGQRVPVPGFGDPARCAATEPPLFELPAHSAPLGLTFSSGPRSPSEYDGDLFVALHGSTFRSSPVGYSLQHIPMAAGQPGPPADFIRGWLTGSESWGRPVDPFVAHDGTLYLTDDGAGVVYRVRPG